MANALYAKGKEAILNKQVDFNTDDLRFVMTDHDVAGAAPVVATDDTLDDISDGTIATSDALNSPTIVDGVFDAADEEVLGVTGDSVESLNIYLHTGTPTTSLLLVYIHEGTNLPFTPNTGNVTVAWHSSGIFAL